MHISDLHINSEKPSYSRLHENLLEDIEDQIKFIKDKTLVIVVTGDIIHQGNKKYIDAAKNLFTKLYDITKDKVVAIYIVPGNHDKFRSNSNKFLAKAYRSIPTPNKSSDENNKELYDNLFYKNFWKFHSDAYKKTNGSGYYGLAESIYKIFFPNKETPKYIKETFGVDSVTINDNDFCFIMLNTAWSCIDDDDSRNLLLGDFQINSIKKQFQDLISNNSTGQNRPKLTILLGHHPINFLKGEEEDKIFKEMISYEDFDANAYLCGHIHDRDIINWANHRHSINTFTTGFGWPERGTSIARHTYSMYVFNLDINSVDVYVRSTDGEGQFKADFSIYTKNVDQNKVKMVYPIASEKSNSYIELSSGTGRSSKSYYVSNDYLKYIKDFNHNLLKLNSLFEKITEQTKINLRNDIFLDDINEKSIILKHNLSIKENLDVDPILYSYLCNSNQEMNDCISSIARDILLIEENQEYLFDELLGFLSRICQEMSKLFLQNQTIDNDDLIRFHFRYLSDKDQLIYKKLCTSFYNKSKNEYGLSDIKYGELIKESYINKKDLIYSANAHFCKNTLSDRWYDFITSVPQFKANTFTIKNNNSVAKNYPYITFGVTTNSEKFNMLLYSLDYFSIGSILGEAIGTYIETFNISLDNFCSWLKTTLEKGEI